MSWLTQALTSSLGKKLVMSLTGLFLVVFLLIHFIGNISLLYKDSTAFNEYAHFMKHSTIILISEVILFSGFILHIIQGIILVIQNKKARPVGYKVAHKNSKVSWTSKLMGPFGIVIFIFLVIHLTQFFAFKFFLPIEEVTSANGYQMAQLYEKVHALFTGDQAIIWIIFYCVSMLVISFHLSHGFQSAFQSLGWNHKKYTPFIKAFGLAYAILIPLAFALIPILVKAGMLF